MMSDPDEAIVWLGTEGVSAMDDLLDAVQPLEGAVLLGRPVADAHDTYVAKGGVVVQISVSAMAISAVVTAIQASLERRVDRKITISVKSDGGTRTLLVAAHGTSGGEIEAALVAARRLLDDPKHDDA